MASKEIIIVGGGIIGCATAYHLAKQGFRSQIIERDSVGSQASGRAWATVSELMTMQVPGTSVPGLFFSPRSAAFSAAFYSPASPPTRRSASRHAAPQPGQTVQPSASVSSSDRW